MLKFFRGEAHFCMADIINKRNLKTSTAIVAAIFAMQSSDAEAVSLTANSIWGSTAGLLTEGLPVELVTWRLQVIGGAGYTDGGTAGDNFVIGAITDATVTYDAARELEIFTTDPSTLLNVDIASINMVQYGAEVYIANYNLNLGTDTDRGQLDVDILGDYYNVDASASYAGTLTIENAGDTIGNSDYVDVSIGGSFTQEGITTLKDSANSNYTRLTISGNSVSGGDFVFNDGGDTGNVYLRIDGANATTGVTVSSNITAVSNGMGVLEVKGGETANSITFSGTVGSSTARLASVDILEDSDAFASNIYFSNKVYAVNMNAGNTSDVPVTFNSLLDLSGNLTYTNDATVNLNANSIVSGNIAFGTYDGILNLADGITINAGGITSGAAGNGIVNLLGNVTLNSNVGDATNSIERIDFLNAGGTAADPVTVNGNVYVDEVRFAGDSTAEFTGSSVNILGNVVGGSYSGNIFTASQTGTLMFVDNGVAQTADVGGSISTITNLKTNYTNSASNLTVDGAVSVGTLNLNGIGNTYNFDGAVGVSTGDLTVVDTNSADANTNNITFGNTLTVSTGNLDIDGNATFNGEVDVTGNITVDGVVALNDDMTAGGNITFDGGNVTTAAGTLINATDLTLAGSAYTYDMNGEVDISGEMTIDGGTVIFDDEVTAANIKDNVGATYNDVVTISANGGIDTSGGVYDWDIDESSSDYSYFENSVLNDILRGTGADVYANGATFNSSVITNNLWLDDSNVTNAASTLSAANLIATGTDTINSVVTVTADIIADNATNLTFNSTVDAANIYVINGGVVNFYDDVNATTLTTDGTTTFYANADVDADTITTADITTFNGNVTSSTIAASGTTTINGILSADTLTSTGTTVVNGAAVVTTVTSKNETDITFGSTLSATTITTEGGTNTFNGDVSATTLTLAGTNDFNDGVTATTFTVSGGTTTVDGDSNITTLVASSTSTLIFNDDLTTTSITTKGGASTFNGSISASAGTITVSGTNIFNDSVSVSTGTITASGTSTFNDSVDAATLTISGTSTFNVGPVIVTTVNAAGTSTFNSALTVTDLNVVSKGDITIAANGGSGNINFSSDGIVRLTDGVTWSGDIGTTVANSKVGTLELQGDRDIDTTLTTDTIKAVNVGDDGSEVEINSNVNALALQIIGGALGTGVTTVNVDLTTDLVFLDEGEVIISSGRSLSEDVDSEQANTGTLTFAGSASVAGDIGSTNALNAINIRQNTVTFSGDVNTQSLVFEGNGQVIIASGGVLTADTVDSDVNNQGTLTIQGNATISSTIGATHTVKLVQAGYSNMVVTFDDTINVGTLEANSGQIYLNDDGSGTLKFVGDGTVTIASGKSWTGTITSDVSGVGKLVLMGDRTISSAITTGKIRSVGVGSAGSTVAVNTSVNATNLEVIGTGAVNVNTNLNNNLLFSANGTTVLANGYNLLKNVDSSSSGIGTLTIAGTSTITGTVGATYAVNLINAGEDGKTVTFSSDVNVKTLAFNGSGSLVFADGADLTVTSVDASVADAGTMTFKGTNVVNGTIGSAATPIGDIYAGYTSGTVTFNNSVSAEEVHIAGTGTVNINGGGDGAILFDANGTAVVDDDVVWAGAVNGASNNKGNIIFSGNSTGITSIGGTAYLNSMTLSGDDDTVVVNGTINSAATLTLGNNNLESGSFSTVTGQMINTTITSSSAVGNVQTTGLSTVHSGTLLNINVNSDEYIEEGTKFLIVEGAAGSSIASLSNAITTSNILLEFDQSGSGNELTASLEYKEISDITSDTNLIEAGNVFFSIPYDTNAYMEQLYIDMQNATSLAQVRSVLYNFVPEVDGGDRNVVVDNNAQVQYLAEQRIDDLRLGDVRDYGFTTSNVGSTTRQFGFDSSDSDYGFGDEEDIESYGFSGVSSGDSVMSSSIWGQVYLNHIEQASTGSFDGYNSDTTGVSLGVDNSNIISNGIVGVSFNYSGSTIESDGTNKITSDIASYGFNFYSNYEFDTGMFVNTQMGFSLNNIEKSRPNAGGAAYVAKADYDSSQLSSKLAFGVDIFPVDGLTVTPVVSLSQNLVDTDGYTETGANTGFNMTVGGHSESLVRAGFKVDAKMNMMDDSGVIIKPGVKVGYFYDITNDPVVTVSNFEASGLSFTTSGPEASSSSFLIGGSMDYIGSDDWEIATDVNYMYKEGFKSYTGIARFTSYF